MPTQTLPVIPDRSALRHLYDAAITEVNTTRSHIDLTKGFYAETGDAVFEAGYLALTDHCKGTKATPKVHVVSAPAGGGKTSFSYALMMALTRYAETHPEAPHGCVFVVDQIKKADEVYRELEVLMPGKVAVWSKEHNRGCKDRIRVPNPAAEFTKDELRLYPVAVVTHAFYSKADGPKALLAVKDHRFHSAGRALVLVDERPEEVETFQTTLKDAQDIREKLEQTRPDLVCVMNNLLLIMMPETLVPTNNLLTRPTDHLKQAEIDEALEWFTAKEAEAVLRDYAKSVPGLSDLFGFAKALTQGCAFTAVSNSVVYFIGWQSKLILRRGTGTVLLDATADIDGISQICPWRQHIKVPQARYDNLEIVHAPQHTKRHLSEYLKTAANQRAYVDHMVEVIKANMKSGELGLIVCKKVLFDAEKVPHWPDKDPRFADKQSYTENFGWEIDGRRLAAINYGTGIGSNHWQRADVVFLFDEFHLPKRIGVANVQGLKGNRANEGELGAIDSLKKKHPLIELFMDGHRLRWTKQLALRGNGRNYDEHGICGTQRLVISSDLKSFTVNVPRLFSGAKVSVINDDGENSTIATKLISLLNDRDLPPVLTTKQIGRLLRLKSRWGTVSRNVLTQHNLKAIEALGWRYVSLKGRKGSRFERTRIIHAQAA